MGFSAFISLRFRVSRLMMMMMMMMMVVTMMSMMNLLMVALTLTRNPKEPKPFEV